MRTSELNTKRIKCESIKGYNGEVPSAEFNFAVAATDLTATAAIPHKVSGFHRVTLAHATVVIAATIDAPQAGELLLIENTSASGTAAHTVTLTSGTWDGTNDVATLNAPGESLLVIGLSDSRYMVLVNTGSVAFS